MGDGKVNRYAIILNGDNEQRHINNANQAAWVLSRGGYKIHIASPQQPNFNVTRYVRPSLANIKRLIAGVRSKIDDDDVLTIYGTGHGDDGKEFCIKGQNCWRNPILKSLDSLKYGQRVFVIDSCYGGNLARYFTDDPRSLFISAGTKGVQVCCGNFAPTFWSPASKISDLNRDGVISWQERFAAAYSGHRDEARLFLPSKGFRDFGVQSGKPARPNFPATVTDVHSEHDLRLKLKKLKPGQYAILAFSMPGCTGCIQFKPQFDAMARYAGGQFLFLRTNSNDLRLKYNIAYVPTVVIVDAFGKVHQVKDHTKVFKAIATLNLSPVSIAIACIDSYVKNWSSRSSSEVENALARILEYINHMSAKEAGLLAVPLKELFKAYDEDIESAAKIIYKKILPKLKASAIAREAEGLRKLYINTYSTDAQATALKYYRMIARRLTAAQRAKEVSTLHKYFKAFYRQDEAMTLYQIMAPSLSSRHAAAEAKFLRALFNNRRAMKYAIQAYAKLGPKLSSAEANAGAKMFRRLFEKPDLWLEEEALKAYGDLAPNLPPAELTLGARSLRKLFTKGYHHRAKLVLGTYKKVAAHLSATEVAKEATILRGLLGSNHTLIRTAAMMGYGMLSKGLSNAEAARGAPLIRAAFNSYSTYSRDAAASAYGRLVPKLSNAEKRLGAKALAHLFSRSYFDETRAIVLVSLAKVAHLLTPSDAFATAGRIRPLFDNKLGDKAVAAYAALAKTLGSSYSLREAKSLRTIIDPTDCEEPNSWSPSPNTKIVNAIKAYGHLARSLPSGELIQGAARLRKLLTVKDPKIKRSLLATYQKIASRLSQTELSNEAKTLRSLFKSEGGYSSDYAVEIYRKTVPYMKQATVQSEARNLRAIINSMSNRKPHIAAIIAYTALINKISPTEAYRGALALRNFFKNWRGQLTVLAVRAYVLIARRLGKAEANREARVLSSYFWSRKVHLRAFAISTYGFLGSNLAKTEVARGASALRTLINRKILIPYALISYAALAPKLSRGEISLGAKMIFKLFKNQNEIVLESALWSFKKMMNYFDPRDLSTGIKQLKIAAKDYHVLLSRTAGDLIKRASKRLATFRNSIQKITVKR